MKGFSSLFLSVCVMIMFAAAAAQDFEKDIIETSAGDLKITFIGHGTLMFTFEDKIVHVDPFSRLADYGKLPDADLILITHDHGDHLDLKAIEPVRTKNTTVIMAPVCEGKVDGGKIMKIGGSATVSGMKVEAIPAYNIVNKRGNGQPYHPKGNGVGFIITFGGKRVYIAGDTENIPEMKELKKIDVAFLPMNLPYTMTPEMAADAARAFKPVILYPYHFGSTDTQKLVDLMKDVKEVEVRIRKME